MANNFDGLAGIYHQYVFKYKEYENIYNCLRGIQQNKNRELNNTKIQGIGLCTVEDSQALGSLLLTVLRR